MGHHHRIGAGQSPKRLRISNLIIMPKSRLFHITFSKYLHSFFADCYMFISLHERKNKLPARHAQRYQFIAYSYTTLLVLTYVIISVNVNGTYGTVRRSKDTIFDDSCVYDPNIDNSPFVEAFAKLIEENPVILDPPAIEHYDPVEYQEQVEYDVDPNATPFPLILADSEELGQKINEFGIPIYWNKITGDISPTPLDNIAMFFSMFLMLVSTACPTSSKKAFALRDWHPPILLHVLGNIYRISI